MHFIRNPMCSLVVRLKTISPWIEFCLIEYKVCKTNFVDCLFFFRGSFFFPVGRCRCIADHIYAYTVVHDFFCGSDGRGIFDLLCFWLDFMTDSIWMVIFIGMIMSSLMSS